MNNKLVINFLILVIIFLIIWFGILPVWSKISSLRLEIKSKQETVNLERQVIEKLNSISQILDSKKTSLERLEEAIPNSELKPELLSIMEKLASQNGLSLSGIDISTEQINSSTTKRGITSEDNSDTGSGMGIAASNSSVSLKKIKINIKASGNYGSFKSWLNAVEKNLRITDVSKISFTIDDKKNNVGESEANIDPAISFDVDMTAYVLSK